MKNLFNLLDNYKMVLIPLLALMLLAGFFVFQNEKPASLNGMIRQSDKYAAEGKLSSALENYTKIARLYPRNYDIHMKLGDLLMQVKEPEKAKIEYYRAVKLGSIKRFDAYLALANIYIDEGNYSFAQEILLPLKDIPDKKIQERLGDFYYRWGL